MTAFVGAFMKALWYAGLSRWLILFVCVVSFCFRAGSSGVHPTLEFQMWLGGLDESIRSLLEISLVKASMQVHTHASHMHVHMYSHAYVYTLGATAIL